VRASRRNFGAVFARWSMSFCRREPACLRNGWRKKLPFSSAKADVREEIDRLKSHLAQGRDCIFGQGGARPGACDFLAQEFNREATTLCSNSSDIEVDTDRT